MSQLIEVLHELGHSNSLVFDDLSNSSEQIKQVFGHLISDEGLIISWFFLKVIERVGMGLRDYFSVFVVFIHIPNKLVIINFIEVPFIHIFLEEQIESVLIFWNEVELLQNSCKLVFCYVADFSNVKILKQRLKVGSFVGN